MVTPPVPAGHTPAPAYANSVNPFERIGLSVPSSDPLPRRVVISVDGWEKSGKTHFALTGREPIVVFNFDVGTEGVVEKFKSAGKEIYEYRIPLVHATTLIGKDSTATPEHWRKHWIEMNAKLEQVYALNPGTVILDTWTEAYELARLAHFGKVAQVMPHQYGPVFDEMRATVRQAYQAAKTTTVFLHKMGTNFETKAPEVKGWNQMPYHVQANVATAPTPAEAGYGMDNFGVMIKDCRQNPACKGYFLYGEQCSLENLEKFILDGSL